MKKKNIIIMLIVVCIFLCEPVNAANAYCTGLKSAFRVVGELIRILKVVIPLFIIALGILDLFRAVTGTKDVELGKSIASFTSRLIGGVLVFFLPPIIEFFFVMLDEWDGYESGYQECVTCVLNVSECTNGNANANNNNNNNNDNNDNNADDNNHAVAMLN